MRKTNVKIKRLTETAVMPSYQTDGSAGCDISADIPEPVVIHPRETALIPTGLTVSVADGDAAILLYARSGLAVRHGISLANGVGVVDSDYRGEIKVALINNSDREYTLMPGERIAQMVFTPVLRAVFTEADTLDDTERGGGGFGSTGKL